VRRLTAACSPIHANGCADLNSRAEEAEQLEVILQDPVDLQPRDSAVCAELRQACSMTLTNAVAP